MELGLILFLVVLGLLVLLVILSCFSGGSSNRSAHSASRYTRQISRTGEEGRRRMDTASDTYLRNVRDITRR